MIKIFYLQNKTKRSSLNQTIISQPAAILHNTHLNSSCYLDIQYFRFSVSYFLTLKKTFYMTQSHFRYATKNLSCLHV